MAMTDTELAAKLVGDLDRCFADDWDGPPMVAYVGLDGPDDVLCVIDLFEPVADALAMLPPVQARVAAVTALGRATHLDEGTRFRVRVTSAVTSSSAVGCWRTEDGTVTQCAPIEGVVIDELRSWAGFAPESVCPVTLQ